MSKLSQQQIDELKAQHGQVVVVSTVEGDCAFRVPTRAEYTRYSEYLFREATRHRAPDTLVQSVVVYPSPDDFAAAVDRHPGIVTTCVGPVLTLAGVDTDADTKNS